LSAAAFDLYRDLVGGRWVLDKPRYLFYATTVRAWLAPNGAPAADIERWMSIDDRKRLLSEAAAEVMDDGDSSRQSPDRSS
jgi:hypothetical protein